MSNLAASRRHDAPGRTCGEGGEVVVVHEPFLIVGAHGVQNLLHAQGGQGNYGEDLGYPPGEQARAVGARQ